MSAEDLTCPTCGDPLYFTGGVIGSGSGTVECLKGHYRGVHIRRPEPPLYVLDDEPSEPDGSRAWLYALGVVLVILAVGLDVISRHAGCAP